MGLGSVMQAGLSGLTAAETAVAYAANNVANARTDGYKSSSPVFVDLAPLLGVAVGGVATDHSQGAIVLDESPTSLALQGEGYFVVEGSDGQRFYTRDGRFTLNANGELTNSSGQRVVGYGVDDDFQLQRQELAPLRIDLDARAQKPDGTTARLVSYSIGGDGRIRGYFDDGGTRDLAQISLARFANPSGLARQGANLLAEGANSGLPVPFDPGQGTTIIGGARELSNTDIAHELLELRAASLWFRANTHVIGTADALLKELMYLGRR
ncbi:MAG: flagellar hook basal-body protein [Planctomycetia bacterium]|nr:flagellar hook basal-body protein [Planctomycetia bacterium]